MQFIISEAKSMFETVPSHIRAKFGEDPAQYLAFMQDPNNIEAIEALGLDASHLEAVSEPPQGPSDAQIDIEALIDRKIRERTPQASSANDDQS